MSVCMYMYGGKKTTSGVYLALHLLLLCIPSWFTSLLGICLSLPLTFFTGVPGLQMGVITPCYYTAFTWVWAFEVRSS